LFIKYFSLKSMSFMVFSEYGYKFNHSFFLHSSFFSLTFRSLLFTLNPSFFVFVYKTFQTKFYEIHGFKLGGGGRVKCNLSCFLYSSFPSYHFPFWGGRKHSERALLAYNSMQSGGWLPKRRKTCCLILSSEWKYVSAAFFSKKVKTNS
jgi:hypothetical protein